MIPTPTSPKVWASTAGTFLASLVLSVALALQADPTPLGGLPKPLLFLLVTILPTVVTFAAGYAQRDPLRDKGAVLTSLQQAGQASPVPSQVSPVTAAVPANPSAPAGPDYVGRHDAGPGDV